MANNFPVMPAMQVATLQYSIDIASLGGATATFPQGILNLLNVEFETTIDGNGVIQFDYSHFDQDAHEANMHTMLNGLCASLAGNLGLSVPTVQSAITVVRTWIFSAATQLLGAYPTCTATDQMAYP